MRTVSALVALAFTALLAVVLTACSAAGGEPPDSAPALRGVIVSISPAEEGGFISVVWHDSAGALAELDSCGVTIRRETRLYDESGAPGTFADLAIRDIVEVWISGPIAESYPPQATADAVQVIGEFSADLQLPVPRGLLPPE